MKAKSERHHLGAEIVRVTKSKGRRRVLAVAPNHSGRRPDPFLVQALPLRLQKPGHRVRPASVS